MAVGISGSFGRVAGIQFLAPASLLCGTANRTYGNSRKRAHKSVLVSCQSSSMPTHLGVLVPGFLGLCHAALPSFASLVCAALVGMGWSLLSSVDMVGRSRKYLFGIGAGKCAGRTSLVWLLNKRRPGWKFPNRVTLLSKNKAAVVPGLLLT